MEKTTQFRNSIPPDMENIGHGKFLVHWNIEEVIPDENSQDQEVQYKYNEVVLNHKPTAKEVKKIKAS